MNTLSSTSVHPLAGMHHLQATSPVGLPASYSGSGFGGNVAARFVTSASETALNRVVDGPLSSFFRATIEDFVAGVMAIDLLALFFPRAGKALVRSSEDYDPRQDPKAMQKTGVREWLYVAGQRLKLLNWSNFVEEFSRELCGGPGLFIPTAILYGFFRKGFGKSSVQLHGDTLKNFANEFAQQAENSALNLNQYDAEGFRAFKNQYIFNLMDVENIAGPNYRGDLKTNKAQLKNWVERYTKQLDNKPEYASRWTPWKDSRLRKAYKEWSIERDALESELKATIEQIRSQNPDRHMNRLDRIMMKINWLGDDKVMKADNFATRIVQWNDFTTALKDHWQDSGKQFFEAFSDVFQKIKKLKQVHLAGTIVATMAALLGGVYVFQHHKEYPANRMIRLQDLNIHQKAPKMPVNRSMPTPATKATPALEAVEKQVKAIHQAQKAANRKASNVIVHFDAPQSKAIQSSNRASAQMASYILPPVPMDRIANGQANVVSFAPLTPRPLFRLPMAQPAPFPAFRRPVYPPLSQPLINSSMPETSLPTPSAASSSFLNNGRMFS